MELGRLPPVSRRRGSLLQSAGSLGVVVPRVTGGPVVFWLYVTEIGFYLHCICGSILLDTRRRDFVVMTIHHVLTIFLLLFSYAVRYHRIGVLVLFILDFGDVWLEISKTFLYFKVRDGKSHLGPELGANISFTVFTMQHILFRLYWFPVKVLYSAMYVSVKLYPEGPFGPSLCSCSWHSTLCRCTGSSSSLSCW